MAARRPCTECPWRVDVEPGQFPPERYEELRRTTGRPGAEVGWDAPRFACHKSPDGREFECAGWLAAVGYEHLGVRISLARGTVDPEAMTPGSDWPELHKSYDDDLLAVHGEPNQKEER